MFTSIRNILTARYATALGLCLGVNALAANLSEIQVLYRLDPWLVSGNYVGGLWVSPPVFGPVTQGGGTFSLEVKAQGVDAQGQTVAITPQWTVSDPTVVMLSSGEGAQTSFVVLKPGQSTLAISYQGLSRQLAITAAVNGTSLLVEIRQQQSPPVTPPIPPVEPPPSLTASAGLLTFAYQIGGTLPEAQVVNVGTNTGSAVPFSASANAQWVSVSAGSPTTPAAVRVSVNPSALMPGTHTAIVTLGSAGTANTQTVAVVLKVTELPRPSLSVIPSALSFSVPSGGPNPAGQSVNVQSSGAAIPFTVAVASGANWLAIVPASGITPSALTVSVNTAGLSPGIYTGSVSVSSGSAVNPLQNIPVTLTITAAPAPALSLSPAALTFDYQSGGALPAAQNVVINSTGSPISFTVSASSEVGSWLSANPASALTSAPISIMADPRGLSPGRYLGAVTISASGIGNSPQVVSVTLVVTGAPSTGGPNVRFSLGVIDKDVNGPSLMLLSGSGELKGGVLQGGGRFIELGVSDPQHVPTQGVWMARRVVSFTPSAATVPGVGNGGTLVIEVGLKVTPGDTDEIPATLKVVADGQSHGVTLTISGGTTFVPTATGAVSLTTDDGQ